MLNSCTDADTGTRAARVAARSRCQTAEKRGNDMKTTMYGQIFNVHFMWDMTPAEFSALYAPHPECTETYDYLGAVFFGDFKLEFIQNADGGYRNLFLYGEDETSPYLYDYLDDGTPYPRLR
jgi:hypothetical protein